MCSAPAVKHVFLLFLLVPTLRAADAQVVTYDGHEGFPDELGWDRLLQCNPERWLQDGQLVESLDTECNPLLEYDVYRRSIAEFTGTDFFVQFSMITDGPSSKFVVQGPATVDLGGLGPVSYHFTIAKDEIRMAWDEKLPWLHIPLAESVPHTFRLELHGAVSFQIFIDDGVVAEGIPEGAYPTPSAKMNFTASAWMTPSTTQWDYVRYGVIPQDGSGDFDSDGAVDGGDYYFFHECAAGSGPNADAGPGCLWADMDQDGDVDFHDFSMFQFAFTGSG